MALASKLQKDPKLRRVSEMLGVFRQLAFAEMRKRIPRGVDELVGLTRGNDLARVLPSEIAKLNSPLRNLTLADFIERKLLSYDLAGSQKVARGGMVVAIDASGSMSGSRAEWASAIGFALQQVAQRQKRPFRGIVFSSPREFSIFDFVNPTDVTPDKVMKFLSCFYGGGTDIEGPLEQGLQWLEEDWAARKGTRSDILLVSDGLVGVHREWQEAFVDRLARVDGRLHAILINERARPPITELANGSVFEVRKLDATTAGTVFADVID
jgi:uncharacterized protein with von Willebrand factor type A (vWA) domain